MEERSYHTGYTSMHVTQMGIANLSLHAKTQTKAWGVDEGILVKH